MNITVTITTMANEKMEKTPAELAQAFLLAAGGDETEDTVNVTVTATAGTPAPLPEPGKPMEARVIGEK